MIEKLLDLFPDNNFGTFLLIGIIYALGLWFMCCLTDGPFFPWFILWLIMTIIGTYVAID